MFVGTYVTDDGENHFEWIPDALKWKGNLIDAGTGRSREGSVCVCWWVARTPLESRMFLFVGNSKETQVILIKRTALCIFEPPFHESWIRPYAGVYYC